MDHPTVKLEKKYVADIYQPIPVIIARGKGAYIWDDKGNKYLDMLSAYSALSHGHAHPRLVKTLTTQAEKLALTSRAVYSENLGLLLEQLCALTGQDIGLPMNSGAESVETAIKAARRWGYRSKKIPHDQAEIIVAEGNFHGRTTTIIGFSSEEKYKEDFGPFAPGFTCIPYKSPKALEEAITPRTCAFLVEPIQGEGGIIIPPDSYLDEISAICRKHNVLLILDEIQSGLGRTGKMFAFQHSKIKPDGIILGKALGGGLLPISVFLASRDVMQHFTPGSHGSTYGGNPLAASIALEAIKVLEEEHLVEKSAELGAYFLKKLQAIVSPVVKEVRGKGLWVGMVINSSWGSARNFCLELMKRGILTKETRGNVVRFAPPFVITQEEIDWAVEQIKQTIESLESSIEKNKDSQ